MASGTNQAGGPAIQMPPFTEGLSDIMDIMDSMKFPPDDEVPKEDTPVWAPRDMGEGVEEWIKPMLPSIAIDEHGRDVIEPSQAGFSPTGSQLDQLFTSEKLQLHSWGGLKSWEARLFGDIDAYVPAGANSSSTEQPWYQAMALNIDESTWLDCFQRSQWTDFDREIIGWPGKLWHMGDDDVWNQMRPILELANRMLLTSLDGEWLGSCLNPYNFEFIANIRRHTGAYGDIFRCHEAAPQNRVSRDQGRRLLNAALFPTVLWAFHDDEHATVDRAWAYCQLFGRGSMRAWISLWTTTFRENFDQTYLSDLTPLRRQIGKMTAAYMTASTICHELMHAACPALTFAASKLPAIKLPNNHRFFKTGWCEFRRLNDPTDEMAQVYGDDKLSELGASFFERTVGCTPQAATELNGWVTMLKAEHMENLYGTSLRLRHGTDKPPKHPAEFNWIRHPIPAVWSMSHATEDFWSQRVNKFGVAALRFVPNMNAKVTVSINTYSYRWYTSAFPIDPSLRNTLPDALEDAQNRIIARLQDYRNLWKEWRSPWYNDALARWQFTPYSVTMYRSKLPYLLKSFRMRDRISAYDALHTARQFIIPLPSRRPKGRETSYPLWFWRGLGFLILAALPRPGAPTYVSEPFEALPNSWRSRAKGLDVRTRDTLLISQAHQKLQRNRENQSKQHGGTYSLDLSRSWCLTQARFMFWMYKEACPVPTPAALEVAFEAQTRKLAAQAKARAATDFLDFDFVLPVYSEEGLSYGVREANACAGVLEREMEFEQELGVAGTQSEETPQFQAQMARVIGDEDNAVTKQEKLRYFTWGEIGDHQVGEGTGWWALKKAGEEFDVYDITDVDSRLQLSDWEVRERVARRRAGDAIPLRVLSDESELANVSETWANAFRELKPIGRALQYTRPEEVALRDGVLRPAVWVMIGQNVYDITDLVSRYDGLKELLFKHAGGVPTTLFESTEFNVTEVLNWLAPYRVRILATPTPTTTVVNDVFTADEVATLGDSDLGMHTIIQGQVYSLASYADLHPGGINLLKVAAGRDSTKDFLRYHKHNASEVLQQVEHLRVGRVVKTRADDAIGPSEIRLMESIYDTSALTLEPSPENSALLAGLKEHAGTDATAEMQKALQFSSTKSQATEHPLLLLMDMKNLVVARVSKPRRSAFEDPISTPHPSAAGSDDDAEVADVTPTSPSSQPIVESGADDDSPATEGTGGSEAGTDPGSRPDAVAPIRNGQHQGPPRARRKRVWAEVLSDGIHVQQQTAWNSVVERELKRLKSELKQFEEGRAERAARIDDMVRCLRESRRVEVGRTELHI